MVANVRTGLDTILAAAPQLPKAERWPALVRYIIAKILAAKPKNLAPPPRLPWASPLISAG
jgi:hypothetical protein